MPSSTRYRNTLEDVIGTAIRKATNEGNTALVDALTRWRCSSDFANPEKNGRSLQGYTNGMDEHTRRKFTDAIAHARSVAEAAARSAHIK